MPRLLKLLIGIMIFSVSAFALDFNTLFLGVMGELAPNTISNSTVINTIISIIGLTFGSSFFLPPKLARVVNIGGRIIEILGKISDKVEKTPSGFKIKDEYLKGSENA